MPLCIPKRHAFVGRIPAGPAERAYSTPQTTLLDLEEAEKEITKGWREGKKEGRKGRDKPQLLAFTPHVKSRIKTWMQQITGTVQTN